MDDSVGLSSEFLPTRKIVVLLVREYSSTGIQFPPPAAAGTTSVGEWRYPPPSQATMMTPDQGVRGGHGLIP